MTAPSARRVAALLGLALAVTSAIVVVLLVLAAQVERAQVPLVDLVDEQSEQIAELRVRLERADARIDAQGRVIERMATALIPLECREVVTDLGGAGVPDVALPECTYDRLSGSE